MKTAGKIFLISLIAVAFYFGIRWYQNRNTKKVMGGTPPNAEDKACASGNPMSKITGSCTKPLFLTNAMGIKEKCFTSEQLALGEGESGWDEVTDANGFGKKWYFNYQSGDRFCYVDKKILAPQ